MELDKKILIDKIYQAIARKHGLSGSDEYIYLCAMRIIKNMIPVEELCTRCQKPDWEKFAAQFGIHMISEFQNGKCGYCKNAQPIPEYEYVWSLNIWKPKCK